MCGRGWAGAHAEGRNRGRMGPRQPARQAVSAQAAINTVFPGALNSSPWPAVPAVSPLDSGWPPGAGPAPAQRSQRARRRTACAAAPASAAPAPPRCWGGAAAAAGGVWGSTCPAGSRSCGRSRAAASPPYRHAVSAWGMRRVLVCGGVWGQFILLWSSHLLTQRPGTDPIGSALDCTMPHPGLR